MYISILKYTRNKRMSVVIAFWVTAITLSKSLSHRYENACQFSFNGKLIPYARQVTPAQFAIALAFVFNDFFQRITGVLAPSGF